ncbi:uncharacterized protein F4822DRAFT_233394 [Hypoxylon trugodes]|uniref:uncharacterized protein n=1 Tax=Hypoxylon trugodes TaxID=326681 RepID=UPI002193EE2E|nr:uncharacterized protein F4822DRAFT_233394 [Hypoxylon trugodes]KAI1390346.1 hypothetical protein F4822DRAFT_233394 [Hypoxylon trugodes]
MESGTFTDIVFEPYTPVQWDAAPENPKAQEFHPTMDLPENMSSGNLIASMNYSSAAKPHDERALLEQPPWLLPMPENAPPNELSNTDPTPCAIDSAFDLDLGSDWHFLSDGQPVTAEMGLFSDQATEIGVIHSPSNLFEDATSATVCTLRSQHTRLDSSLDTIFLPSKDFTTPPATESRKEVTTQLQHRPCRPIAPKLPCIQRSEDSPVTDNQYTTRGHNVQGPPCTLRNKRRLTPDSELDKVTASIGAPKVGFSVFQVSKSPQPAKRRRKRVLKQDKLDTRTCLRCQDQHLNCSGGFPCSNCETLWRRIERRITNRTILWTLL